MIDTLWHHVFPQRPGQGNDHLALVAVRDVDLDKGA